MSPLDNCIFRKRETKRQLAEKHSFSWKKPLLGIVLDKELSKEDETHLSNILAATQHVKVQVVVLADTNLDALSSAHLIVLPYNRKNRNTLLEASDMAICFSFSDVEEMLMHGTIPISPLRPEVRDYNPNRETGNSFIYREKDSWSIFAALVRALETFKFPYDWKNIVRHGLKSH